MTSWPQLAMADGPHVGMALLARAGDADGAATAYRRAIELTQNAAEREALEARSRGVRRT